MFPINELNYVDTVKQTFSALEKAQPFYHDHMLPLLFNLDGKPLTLDNHFQMRSLFSRVIPPQKTYKTGRQVSKSMSNAVQSILFAATNPFHNILHIAPLYVHIERFSNDYVAPLLAHSPCRNALTGPDCKRAILQRSLKNGSNLIFTFAFHDCTRVRGITANLLKYDEYQSLDQSFEPIINQTLAAAELKSSGRNEEGANLAGIMRFGTPLTLDNGLEQAWTFSSQAEWCIPCRRCKKLNIPSLREDIEKMMGPKRRTEPVTPETPGLVCAKCGHYLYTREGQWIHLFPERREKHAGYHIPQCVMTFHCEKATAWERLQQYRFNENVMSKAQFYNEICGESYDHGQKLISVTDLKKVAVLPPKTDKDIHLKWIAQGRYKYWGVGIDWGGGGVSGISKTAFALAGMRSDGIIEVFTGYRSNTPNDHNREAARTRDICNVFRCQFAAMDYAVAGSLRYTKLLDHGFNSRMIVPMEYVKIGQGAIARHAPAIPEDLIPARIQMHKARSLLILSFLIRAGRIRFFEYDYKTPEEPGLLHDFTALAEEYVPMKTVGDEYRIIHVPTLGPDDFAQAVNYAVCALYTFEGGYPDTGSILSIGDLSPEQKEAFTSYGDDRTFNWFYGEEEF
jgi:hypothetical protein